MNGELEDLITRHFDGHLDVAGQRRLAEMLADSADARQTFARYLRLEGAALKLGMAPQLELQAAEASLAMPATEVPSVVGEPAVSPAISPVNKSRTRWVYVAWLAAAASLLVALVVGQRLFQPQPVDQVAHVAPIGELDRLAEVWMELQDNSPIDEPAPTDSAPAAPSVAVLEGGTEPDLDESKLDEPEVEADSAPPPAWMLAALADLAMDPPHPDEK